MFKVQFTQLREDGLNYIIGEKEFSEETSKETINAFVKNAMEVYNSTMKGRIGYILLQGQNDFWTIPVNDKTLRNEITA